MSYIAEPLQRRQLRGLAGQLREALGLGEDVYFSVMPFLEQVMPCSFESFHYEIVPPEDLPPERHAETDIAGRIVRIREDVYYGALDRTSVYHGRDRMTVMHEIAHYLLMVSCGVKFNRTFGQAPVITYQDPEWQAKALAGEIMCPHHLIGHLTVDEVARECGVSKAAANFNLKISRGGEDYRKP